MRFTLRSLILSGGTSFLLSAAACDVQADADDRASSTTAAETRNAHAVERSAIVLANASIEAYRVELLELAMDAASAMPVQPHIKTRSRLQEQMVDACITLNQPARADAYAARVADWRQGSAYGSLALYAAMHEQQAVAKEYLWKAEDAAKADLEDWRRDQILSKIARTYVTLGNIEEASRIESELSSLEAGIVDQFRATTLREDEFDTQLAKIDGALLASNSDMLLSALKLGVELFDRLYRQPELRNAAERKIRASWEQLSPVLRVELLLELGQRALKHDDREKALALAVDARTLIDYYEWHAETRVPLLGRLASMRAHAGDTELARKDTADALSLFETSLDEIEGMFRAETLVPTAEAHYALGDKDQSLVIYRRALEEGAVNPNARPRTEDLIQICCSMALGGVEPDADLWERMRSIRRELGQPW